jgi:hypothetical protein
LTSSYPKATDACIDEHFARHHAQPKSVVEFAVGQQPGIRGDNGAAKSERQAAIEIEPNRSNTDSPVGFASAASLDP